MKYSISEISEIISAKTIGLSNHYISQIATDSRAVINASDTVFFALKGKHTDGHHFINDLMQKEVKVFVVNHIPENLSDNNDVTFLLVENILEALQILVAHHRKNISCEILAITGSNGKTIIKEWLFQILQFEKKIVRSPKSFNSQIGVPLSVWQLEKINNFAIFEAGISKPGEMEKLVKIIDPSLGIFTNLGDAHQEFFEDLKQKAHEKAKLFRNCNALIYCKDHQIISDVLFKTIDSSKTRLFSWSLFEFADLVIIKIDKQDEQTSIKAKYLQKEISIKIPFVDEASIENCIHIWALLIYLGYTEAFCNERFMRLQPVAMRLEAKDGINNCTLINDTYNSDLNSLAIALESLANQQQHPRKVLILSDILQSAHNQTELYQQVAKLVMNYSIDLFIGIGETIGKYAYLFDFLKDIEFYDSTDVFLATQPKNRFHNETILLKGSRDFRLERIANELQFKTHRTVLEINVNALIHNLNYFRALLEKNTKVMIMVKAFSYGSGSYEIANLLQSQNVDYLGVAVSDEGVELRKAGILLPIMVMNPEEQSFENMIEYGLEPEIFNFQTLKKFSKAVSLQSLPIYPIHIKLDTGMHRLGFEKKELDLLVSHLQLYDNLCIKSVFSHLAAADEPEKDSFTGEQITLFTEMTNFITEELQVKFWRHLLNSSGIERFTGAQFEMVRLGIGLYGISAEQQNQLENISTLKTKILQIKYVEVGETVGYGRRGIITKKSKIATLPIGYADGLSRKLSNGAGRVWINGQHAPFIGNICMDLCMVDISELEAKVGDDVIIFGKENSISYLAKQIGTIPYEILTSISRRVKRVYIQDYL